MERDVTMLKMGSFRNSWRAHSDALQFMSLSSPWNSPIFRPSAALFLWLALGGGPYQNKGTFTLGVRDSRVESRNTMLAI